MQDSLTTSLSLFPKLRRLSLSGPFNAFNEPFFARSPNWAEYNEFAGVLEKHYGTYAPESFSEAARDLADGCRTLDVVTMSNMVGDLLIKHGLSARIVRESEGGAVKDVKRIRAWGNIIGRVCLSDWVNNPQIYDIINRNIFFPLKTFPFAHKIIL